MARRIKLFFSVLAAATLAACATLPSDTGVTTPDPETDAATVTAAKPAATPKRSKPSALMHIPPLELPMVEDESSAEEAAFEDLIERLRSGFVLPPVDRPEVAQQVAWFVRHPDYLERVLNRARPYLPHVADEVEARGLPGELAFLPIIESAFDPFAYSHGRAAGLWQIIPGTGRRFGLKQNWWYDGRRDVVESTRAALDYLEHLHGLFDGDWLLAVAAYNCGEGTVGRAIRANRAAGRPTDVWHLRLPTETRNYVPRLLGLAAVIADPESHAVSLPAIPNGPGFAAVELDGQIDLAVAAELAEIELAELQALNPGFNRWATDPDGPHRLLLPVDSAEPFTLAVAELPASERVRWHRHAVRQGDTLGGIARRYGTTVSVLQAVNGLSGTTIRAGSHLMVPTATRSVDDYPLSAENRLASTQSRERAGRVRSEYTVRRGDSLWSISRRHGVNVRELAAWNGMAPGDTLSVGRTLVVWQHASSGSAAGRPATPPAAAPQLRRINYTVRRGDSLYRIANNFRVSVDDIRRWNSLDPRRHLQPGQRLILHVDVTAQSGG